MSDVSLARKLARDFMLYGTAAPLLRLDPGLPSRPGATAPPPAAIAIGAFDGVHRGHRHLLDGLIADARACGVEAVAVTFDPDPDTVVAPAPAPKLMTRHDRLAALARSGVDRVVVVPFTPELAALDHRAFFDDVLGRILDIRSVHVGSNFRLGAHGAGTVEVLKRWGEERGITVTGHELVWEDGSAISATRIRGLIAQGDLPEAKRLLGRPYAVRGTVVHGRGKGTGMGFPTANVARSELIQMPADGVYAGWTLVPGMHGDLDVAYPSAVNVGLPPMFANDPSSATLEATLLGFSGDLYGREVTVLFTERLRPPIHFSSIGELVSAVRGNIEDVRQQLGSKGASLAR